MACCGTYLKRILRVHVGDPQLPLGVHLHRNDRVLRTGHRQGTAGQCASEIPLYSCRMAVSTPSHCPRLRKRLRFACPRTCCAYTHHADCHRQHAVALVVNVLANEIHASCSEDGRKGANTTVTQCQQGDTSAKHVMEADRALDSTSSHRVSVQSGPARSRTAS